MLRIQGLGPKKIKALYEALGITTVGELEYACNENRLLDLPGFGKKTQENVLEGIAYLLREFADPSPLGEIDVFGLQSNAVRSSVDDAGFLDMAVHQHVSYGSGQNGHGMTFNARGCGELLFVEQSFATSASTNRLIKQTIPCTC